MVPEKKEKQVKISRKEKKEDHDVEKERKEQPLEGYLKPCARWQSQRPIRDYGSL